MAAAPSLTPEQAKTALNEIWARFQRDESRQMFESLVAECNQAENPLQAKMLKFPPAVQSVCADLMAELGFNETTFMMGVMQIQMHAAKDPDMSSKVGFLMQAFMGNMPAKEDAAQEAEMCD